MLRPPRGAVDAHGPRPDQAPYVAGRPYFGRLRLSVDGPECSRERPAPPPWRAAKLAALADRREAGGHAEAARRGGELLALRVQRHDGDAVAAAADAEPDHAGAAADVAH